MEDFGNNYKKMLRKLQTNFVRIQKNFRKFCINFRKNVQILFEKFQEINTFCQIKNFGEIQKNLKKNQF